MATKENESAVLHAISKADAEVLREILRSIYDASVICRPEIERRLLVSSGNVASTKRKADETLDGEHSKGATEKKAKKQEPPISRFEVCETCKKTFDVTKNGDDACQTHEGLLEIDPECIPDDDQVEYEPESIDPHTDWRRKKWPQGFVWDCCEEDIRGTPCVIQRHIAKGKKSSGYGRSEANPVVLD